VSSGNWRWWRALSLRGRITLVATGLFAIAVASGAVITLFVVRISLTHTLDSGAIKTGNDIAALVRSNRAPNPILATSGGVVQVQVVDANNRVINASPGGDFGVSMVSPDQLSRVRGGARIEVVGVATGVDDQLRVIGVPAGTQTVLVATDAGRVDQAVRIVREAALVGGPTGVLIMALLTYWVVGQTLRPVAGLRHGAEEIAETGLTDQRLPVPDAQDEIHRLAETLNAMLDRITASNRRQRTFVGDAAHELRSPLASLRVQLEVAGRLGPAADWQGLLDDVLIDVDRLEQLVTDLLILARNDEGGGALRRREPVEFGELVYEVVSGYETARVPVDIGVGRPIDVTVMGDRDSLRRVVVNLIDNAVRYAATSVTVRLERSTGSVGPPTVQLAVCDDGPGIAAAERERVFDRFYRTAESRSRESGGTGLGLPIVRDLVRAHGGTVRLAASADCIPPAGPGLTAIVTLPAVPPT
jgi:signal transduction histidine kinase